MLSANNIIKMYNIIQIVVAIAVPTAIAITITVTSTSRSTNAIDEMYNWQFSSVTITSSKSDFELAIKDPDIKAN